jgi:cytochrome c
LLPITNLAARSANEKNEGPSSEGLSIIFLKDQRRRSMKKLVFGLVILMFLFGAAMVQAEGSATKDQAVAMVKKAIEYIKANGNEKAFAEIDNPKGQFVDRDLYVVVYDMNGKCLAHGQKKSMVGKSMIDFKDVDGKLFMQERVALMKKQNSGWQSYKFMDPLTKKIEPKEMYVERTGDLIVGAGVYTK